jgi:hypothetical protein
MSVTGNEVDVALRGQTKQGGSGQPPWDIKEKHRIYF